MQHRKPQIETTIRLRFHCLELGVEKSECSHEGGSRLSRHFLHLELDEWNAVHKGFRVVHKWVRLKRLCVKKRFWRTNNHQMTYLEYDPARRPKPSVTDRHNLCS